MATAVGEAGERPRAALCAALSAAVRGCAATGIAAGDALDLLCAALSTAERGPATSAAFVTPQVSAATDAPQPDCGPGPADICVIVARGVTMGRGSTTAGTCARSKSIQPVEREKLLPPGGEQTNDGTRLGTRKPLSLNLTCTVHVH